MNTIEQAYEEYIAELTSYREWTDERKRVYGPHVHPMEGWSNSDYDRITEWNKSLNLVQRVLGLSEEESIEADWRAGIGRIGVVAK